MSWSVNFIGTPEKVSEALTAQSAKLTGDSKMEYDAALPHLIGLVNQNCGPSNAGLIKVVASGHGYNSPEETNNYRQLKVDIEPVYGMLV